MNGKSGFFFFAFRNLSFHEFHVRYDAKCGVCDMTMILIIAENEEISNEKKYQTIETKGAIAIGIRLCNQ